MMLIELGIEPRPITSSDQIHTQPVEPRIRHPQPLPPPGHLTPVSPRTPSSHPSPTDYEKALRGRASNDRDSVSVLCGELAESFGDRVDCRLAGSDVDHEIVDVIVAGA